MITAVHQWVYFALAATHFGWAALFALDWNHADRFPRRFVRCYALVSAVVGLGFVAFGAVQ